MFKQSLLIFAAISILATVSAKAEISAFELGKGDLQGKGEAVMGTIDGIKLIPAITTHPSQLYIFFTADESPKSHGKIGVSCTGTDATLCASLIRKGEKLGVKLDSKTGELALVPNPPSDWLKREKAL